jgi:drug/metabolite transporter superfamily protein YnfA
VPAVVLVVIVQASFLEWIYHRYWLHRPWLPPQMFTAHTLVHHQLCKHDDTFHVHDEEQEEALTFQWWGGPVLIAINLIPWVGAWWALRGAMPLSFFVVCLTTMVVTFGLYYAAYEGFHYLMHRPSIAWIERSRPFRFIERHHRIHHAEMGKNFNVVVPLADLVLGTLLLRDPSAPRTTSPAARAIARRHSRFGRKLTQ